MSTVNRTAPIPQRIIPDDPELGRPELRAPEAAPAPAGWAPKGAQRIARPSDRAGLETTLATSTNPRELRLAYIRFSAAGMPSAVRANELLDRRLAVEKNPALADPALRNTIKVVREALWAPSLFSHAMKKVDTLAAEEKLGAWSGNLRGELSGWNPANESNFSQMTRLQQQLLGRAIESLFTREGLVPNLDQATSISTLKNAAARISR